MESYRELAERGEWKKLAYHEAVVLYAVYRDLLRKAGKVRGRRPHSIQLKNIEGLLMGMGLMVTINGKHGPENVMKYAEIMNVLDE